jgi:hypothetical protein
MIYCNDHSIHDPLTECPVCVLEERDRLKAILDRCHNEMVLDGFGEGHGETDEDNAYQVRLRTDLAQAIGREF